MDLSVEVFIQYLTPIYTLDDLRYIFEGNKTQILEAFEDIVRNTMSRLAISQRT